MMIRQGRSCSILEKEQEKTVSTPRSSQVGVGIFVENVKNNEQT